MRLLLKRSPGSGKVMEWEVVEWDGAIIGVKEAGQRF